MTALPGGGRARCSFVPFGFDVVTRGATGDDDALVFVPFGFDVVRDMTRGATGDDDALFFAPFGFVVRDR